MRCIPSTGTLLNLLPRYDADDALPPLEHLAEFLENDTVPDTSNCATPCNPPCDAAVA